MQCFQLPPEHALLTHSLGKHNRARAHTPMEMASRHHTRHHTTVHYTRTWDLSCCMCVFFSISTVSRFAIRVRWVSLNSNKRTISSLRSRGKLEQSFSTCAVIHAHMCTHQCQRQHTTSRTSTVHTHIHVYTLTCLTIGLAFPAPFLSRDLRASASFRLPLCFCGVTLPTHTHQVHTHTHVHNMGWCEVQHVVCRCHI